MMPTRMKGFTVEQVTDAMKHDKKRAGKMLRFVIPTAPGNAKILDNAPEPAVEDAVAWALQS